MYFRAGIDQSFSLFLQVHHTASGAFFDILDDCKPASGRASDNQSTFIDVAEGLRPPRRLDSLNLGLGLSHEGVGGGGGGEVNSSSLLELSG
jgi:hypothetical protein